MRCSAASAQTAITNDQANHYYQACLTEPADSRMDLKARQALCACNAAHLVQNMSQEDYAAIGKDGDAGQDAFRHFILNIYTPCMSIPVGDIVYGDCMQLPNLSMMGLKAGTAPVCRCTGDKTASWFTDNGRDLVAAILRDQPDTVNPFDPVMANPDLKRVAYDNLTACTGTAR